MADGSAMVVDGIEVHVSAETLDDWEITEAIADVMAGEGAESLGAAARYMRLLFGADYERVKAELRAKNGGRLTNECMNAFAARVVEAAGAKN